MATREQGKRVMKYCCKKDVVARTVAGVNVLVPVHGCTRSVYTLNDVGAGLWELIVEPKSQDELAGALVEQYQVAMETARRDVQAFIDDLMRLGLVEEQA